jgi:NAD+ kinase
MAMAFRSVGICLKPNQPQLADVVRGLEKWLAERGLEVHLSREAAAAAGGSGLERHVLAARVDLVLVLGGDGTILAVARAVGSQPVPILGVNLGTLGFLAEISFDELYPTLEQVLAERFLVEPRMRLSVSVQREGREVAGFLALNDAVISNTVLSRMVDLETSADGAPVAIYHADGLIAATPTGSSAYSLSAGGPLVLPDLEAIVLTPICPHALTQRPLVLPETSEIEVRVLDTRGGQAHLTVDGQVGCPLDSDARVRVRRSPHPARLLVHPGRNRFEVMRKKLRWGER